MERLVAVLVGESTLSDAAICDAIRPEVEEKIVERFGSLIPSRIVSKSYARGASVRVDGEMRIVDAWRIELEVAG